MRQNTGCEGIWVCIGSAGGCALVGLAEVVQQVRQMTDHYFVNYLVKVVNYINLLKCV